MTIKLNFDNWMKFGKEDGTFTIQDALKLAKPKWENAGLKAVSITNDSDLSIEFKVNDKTSFFLSVIQYGIEFEEIVDLKKLREDVNRRMF